jgi:3-oxoacyl-[acyl-carrier-protein] synthase-3
MALDVSLGCSGYVYGLSVIHGLISNGDIKKALLLAGEVPTPNSSYSDKSVYPLFGDAGTATAIEFQRDWPAAYFNLQTDGSGYNAIMIPDGGMRNYIDPVSSFVTEEIMEGIERNRTQIALDGMKVFNFTLQEVRPNVRKVLELAEKTVDDIDFYIFHQANRLMNETIRKQLKIPPEKYPYSIGKFGNTSSASIPLTIAETIGGDNLVKRNRLLFSGFGVGLSWGSVIVETEDLYCHPIIEY